MNKDLKPGPVERASFPPRQGNSVDVLVDGMEAFERIARVAEKAKSSLWVTVAFFDPGLRMPATGETFLELAGRLAARGVDVRLLFWWSEYPGIGSFRGEAQERALLESLAPKVKARWDRVTGGCHHQKSYVVDHATAFVGGINLNNEGLSSPEHEGPGFHDLFCQLKGPAVADVAANFAERWNQASETADRGHAYPSAAEAGGIDHPLPGSLTNAGDTTVQVLRTIGPGIYTGERGWKESFELSGGENSVQRSLLASIRSASAEIYIENQYLLDVETIEELVAAADRGVEIVAVLPLVADPNIALYGKKRLQRARAALARLGAHAKTGLFGVRVGGRPLYVHAKLMIVDERIVNLGSANLWSPSYRRDSELNLLLWDPKTAARLKRRLWREHLDGRKAAGLAAWKALADGDRGNDGEGRKRHIVGLDPLAYYSFEGIDAPWQGIEPREARA